MSNQTAPSWVTWRFYAMFFLGDALLIAAAYGIFYKGHPYLSSIEVACMAGTVALGALLGVLPFVMRYRAEMKLVQSNALADTLAQIQNLEQVAERITRASAQWQTVQEVSARTATTAKEVADRMSQEAVGYFERMEKANNSEKQQLRLEAEKLRRAENDWLRLTVQLLDYVFMLYSQAVRANEAMPVDKLENFQNACRDAVRRVGLLPLVVAPGTSYDPEHHQLADPKMTAPQGARIADTYLPGYTYQGMLCRAPVVTLETSESRLMAEAGLPAGPIPEDTADASRGSEREPRQPRLSL